MVSSTSESPHCGSRWAPAVRRGRGRRWSCLCPGDRGKGSRGGMGCGFRGTTGRRGRSPKWSPDEADDMVFENEVVPAERGGNFLVRPVEDEDVFAVLFAPQVFGGSAVGRRVPRRAMMKVAGGGAATLVRVHLAEAEEDDGAVEPRNQSAAGWPIHSARQTTGAALGIAPFGGAELEQAGLAVARSWKRSTRRPEPQWLRLPAGQAAGAEDFTITGGCGQLWDRSAMIASP